MSITVHKRIDLGFLGEEYDGSYLVFQAISLRDFEGLQAEAKRVGDDGAKSLAFAKNEVTKRFIEGKIKQGGKLVDLTAEDLPDLPADVFVSVFTQMTGTADPKV